MTRTELIEKVTWHYEELAHADGANITRDWANRRR